MNCKPGDLAVTFGMVCPENNDVIVEVESFDRNSPFGVIWNIKHRSPMRTDSGRLSVDGRIHDCNLRPISGVPVDDLTPIEVSIPEAATLAWGIRAPVLA